MHAYTNAERERKSERKREREVSGMLDVFVVPQPVLMSINLSQTAASEIEAAIVMYS